MSARDSRSYLGTSVLGPAGVVSLDRADKLHRGIAEVLLPVVLVSAPTAGAFEPIPSNLLQELGDALSLGSGGLLKIRFEPGRKAPAIDLGFHARHCSAISPY